MRIKLASWYGDHAPGEEIEVDETTAKALRRDGRVAEVIENGSYENGGALEPGVTVAANESGEPEPVEPPPAEGRKRR